MKTKILNNIKAISAILLLSINSYGQCPNNNSAYGSIGNLSPGQTGTIYCMFGGEYATVNVTNGATYVFSTCGGSWDSQLTLYTTGGTYLAYNDDACGLQSEITWTASFTGQVRVMLDRYYCSNYYSCMNLNVTRNANGGSNPCQSASVLSCNQSATYNLGSGSGSWNPPGPWGTPGKEKVFSFTASVTGIHDISMTHSSSGWVDLFIKSGNCNQSGWTYIDDIYSSATNSVSLVAGQTYQFLIDDENTSASSGTISISCPTPAPDPCSNITSITCGNSESFSLSNGNGAWDPTSGPWGTPGMEQVYSFTPTVSGNYDISVSHVGGYYVDLFYKTGSCSGNGWNYVDDIYSSATNTLYLSAGTTYLFLIDDENTSTSSGSINISCPCIGNTIDGSISANGSVTVFNNTSGACDDCSLRSSEDITYAVEIPCPGTYTLSTCGLASWDTYLYLTNSPCSGILASNDDNCGLQSSITYTFGSAGTYYLTVEGFSSSSAGAFGVSIDRTCDLTVSISADTYNCGYNISCNGLNDGTALAIANNGCGSIFYQWSNGSTHPNATYLAAGTYNVTATDQWGCIAHSSITLTEPDQLEVDAGNDQTVYYGYTPLACADISASANGGCAEYVYNWSENGVSISTGSSQTVCPTSSTDYTVTVTDENGCTASDDVHICVIDVTCYAGNSGNQKVEMCHYPPGNPGNAHTICVDASAVPAHLAHGCSLGDCSEIGSCDPNARTVQTTESRLNDHLISELHIAPNPFNSIFAIEIDIIEKGDYNIEILDMRGSVIKKIDLANTNIGYTYLEVDLSNVQSGTYLIKSNINGHYEYIKVVKQ